jgi:putative hydrolase of the HAD superfamily
LKYKAVLFDLGSTLIEFENSDWHTLGKTGVLNAYPYLKSVFPQVPTPDIFGPAFYAHLSSILDKERQDNSELDLYEICEMIFAQMGLFSQDGIVARFVELYYHPITIQISILNGAPKLLEDIDNAGMTIGLVSNTIFPEQYHLGEMERFGLLKHFDFTIFSSRVKIRKPAVEIFRMALDKAGVKANEAIFVGDRFDADIIGAKNTGIPSVWMYHPKRENPDNIQPDFSINELDELRPIIFA